MDRREKMGFPLVMLSVATRWMQSCYRVARKITGFRFLQRNSAPKPVHLSTLHPSATKCPLERREKESVVCDIQGALLRSSSFFPFFMLVAFEGGSPLRALLLLLSCPLLISLGYQHEVSLRVMAFITFCGLRTRDMDLVARAVLPKFYLENLDLQAYEVLASSERRVVFTSIPRVMVEGFLKEYLGVEKVVGAELQVVNGCYFTGLFSDGFSMAARLKALEDLFGETERPDVGLVSTCNPYYHLFISYCKETYVVNNEDSRRSGSGAAMPKERYPKPVIFHDGRLAFLPTPLSALFLFLWLPFGITLAIFRTLIGLVFPYKLARSVSAFTGFRMRIQGLSTLSTVAGEHNSTSKGSNGVLYVSNHRTLLDPVIISNALRKPVTAVTYSLSKVSEMIAPVKTVRLARDRERDSETMRRLLGEGDLVVCPEGTTCREPYLLRFSSLFAELTESIVPVAVDATVSMFHGTTASGLKWLDPVFFLMNPRAEYRVEFLGRVPRELTCAGGGRSGQEVANRIQRQLAAALGFECTRFTRKDKYMMLAGNEGVVEQRPPK